MRFGYWMPVFGGWLRNVEDEGMGTDWPYVRDLAVASERQGFDVALLAELNLNDIKGHHAPSLDAWTLAPALAAVTERLELMLAVRPTYHLPTLTAKALSTLDTIAPGRLSLNVVSSWWRDEALQYGVPFDEHDARYARTEEWLGVLSRLLREPVVTHHGPLYDLERHSPGRRGSEPPMQFGVSGFVVCRDTEAEARAELDRVLDVRASPAAYASYRDFVAGSQLESRVSLEEYSVSNRGLRAGLVGTPDQLVERVRAYEEVGVDLLLLQLSPQREEMERVGRDVVARYQGA